MNRPCFEYVVNLHVHTTFSDGSGSMEEVIKAGQKAGLDVLLINDHDTLAARAQGYEGYHAGLLVLVGVEASGPHHHYLAYGLSTFPGYDWRNPQSFIDHVRAEGGVGFIAHPFEKGSPMSDGGHAFTWLDWSVTGFNGLCIWNYTSAWKTRARNLATGIWHYFLRHRTLMGPDQETLAKWDELGQTRRVAAVGGSDNHAFKYRLGGPLVFKIFPYENAFQAVNTHVLLPEPLSGAGPADGDSVFKALAEGSTFVAHDRLRDSRGFDFWLENRGGFRAGQGQEVKWASHDEIVWRLPAPAEVRLINNGRIIAANKSDQGRVLIEGPGVYRLEAYWRLPFFGLRPWIFSNPVYIRE